MKTFKFLSARTVAMSCVVSFLLVACSKDKNADPAPSTTSYYLKCKINGASYVAVNPIGVDTNNLGVPAYAVYDNNGSTANTLLLGLTDIPSSSLWGWEGTYVDPMFNTYDQILTNYPVTTTVVHDSVNHILSGTFSFHLADSWDTTSQVTVTEGQFRVHY